MSIKKSNYSILVDVDLDVENINKQLKDVQKNIKPLTIPGVKETNKDLKETGKSLDNVSSSIGNTEEAMLGASLTFQAANEVLRRTVDIISSMVEQVYALDSAIIEFQKVSDLSGQSLDSYISKLNDMGDSVARTGSEMLEAATDFRKNGFNDEDSAQLAQIATMFQNVSDETISAGESASFIIAQMTAFGIAAEDASKIIDSVNEVANNFSVSSGDLSKSLGIVASSSSAMGNSLEETLGMLTAITEITRNSSKASRGLNTIMANLAQVLDENSSNGVKIVKIFEDLGLSMMDSTGQLKTGYELLSELAGVWKTLDGNTQKYISTTIAGK